MMDYSRDVKVKKVNANSRELHANYANSLFKEFATIRAKESLNNLISFTLVELLVTISIFTFMMGAVYTTFLVGNRSWMTSSDKVALQREVRWALFAMTKELREAQDIFITNDPTSTKITFNRPMVGQVSYSLNSIGGDANKIIRQDESRERILARDISYLSFTYLTTDAITVEITATKKPLVGPEISFHLKEKVGLRL